MEFNEQHPLWGIRLAIKDALKNINTCLPARVEGVALDFLTVDAKPMLKNPYTGDEYPTLKGVPVLMNLNTALAVRAAIGDIVLLIFSQHSLENWIPILPITGDTTAERHFDLSDGFALPLVFSSLIPLLPLVPGGDGVVTGKCACNMGIPVHAISSTKVMAALV